MSTLIENGYPIFTDKEGLPLEDGYIHIGESGLNPVSNPQTAYWDADLTVPARNIRTSQGYPVYNGSPSRLYVADGYSILVQDKQLNTVYVLLDALSYVIIPSPAAGFDYTQVETSGASTVLIKEGSRFDISGEAYTIISDTYLAIPLVGTNYYIQATIGGSGVALSLNTDSGIFDVDLNARYDGSARVLNWEIRRDASAAYIAKVVDPVNLYSVDQDVRHDSTLTVGTVTTNTVTTNTVNTGQGDNELYGMNQGVKTTNSVEFTSVKAKSTNLAYFEDANTQNRYIYDAFSSYIPTVGDWCAMTGTWTYNAGSNVGILNRAERVSSTAITFYYQTTNGSVGTYTLTSGNTASVYSFRATAGAKG